MTEMDKERMRKELKDIEATITRTYARGKPHILVFTGREAECNLQGLYIMEHMEGETLLEFCDRVGETFAVMQVGPASELIRWTATSDDSLEDAIGKWNAGDVKEEMFGMKLKEEEE